MRKLWNAAGIFAVFAVMAAMAALMLLSMPSSALAVSGFYRFDGVYGPSGTTSMGAASQWMVITEASDTVGNITTMPMDASGDIVSGLNDIILESGRCYDSSGNEIGSINSLTNRKIKAVFLLLPGSNGELNVNFASTASDATTPDVLIDNEVYDAQKGSPGLPSGYSYQWRQYQFSIQKNLRQGVYESVRGNLVFNQNPSSSYPSTPSQTVSVPFVIANVNNTPAQYEPLIFRMTLRDKQSSTQGDIVAYDHFTWSAMNDETTGNSQWVLVPVESWPINNTGVYYYLTPSITNHSGVRYRPWNDDQRTPQYWRFDLPHTRDFDNVPETFQLDPLNHVVPGLTAVYSSQRYNMNEGEKVPLSLYPIDPANGPRNLTLNHRVIWGVNLGEASGTASGRSAVPYKVTAFNPRAASGAGFLENVASVMMTGSGNSVLVPEGKMFSANSVSYKYVAGDVIQSFAVDQSISGNVRSSGNEGMLPLHVTVNLPSSNAFVAPYWDELLSEWHSGGDVHALFSRYFSIFLRSGEDNDLDLIQKLIEQDAYNDQIKVFVDEDRKVITVSFIVMLMDGTRDGARPAMYLVNDTSVSTNNKFIVLRDGNYNNKWDMTFYVAPANYTENPDRGSGGYNMNRDTGGSSGCNAGMGMWLLIPAFLIGGLARCSKK